MAPTRGWLDGDDPEVILKRLRGHASERKLRLATAALCRHVYPAARLTGPRLAAVEVIERMADGEAGAGELARARAEVAKIAGDGSGPWQEGTILGAVQGSAYGGAWRAMRQAIHDCASMVREGRDWSNKTWEAYQQARSRASWQTAEVLRDVLGHLGREEEFDPGWRTPDVVGLAGSIYRGGAFESLPVLGDALEEAGCTDGGLLGHLRGGGLHVRGCWALDLALGRG